MNWIERLFSTSGFIPHGFCYTWDPHVIWLNGASDALIALAYYTIPFTLVYFVRRRKDLAFHWVFLSFALFIVACGTTHAIELWSIWHPAYWLAGAIKALTAAASIGTAVALIQLVPKALVLPSPDDLKRANRALQEAQQALLKTNEELERRVVERTASLAVANTALQVEIEERKRTDAYLSEAQRLSHTGSFGWDVSSGKIYWSQETFRILGYDPPAETSLELVFQRTHPDDRELVRQVIDRARQERKDFDFEHRLLMPKGCIKYLRVVGHPSTEDESGNPEFVGAVTDITQRKLAEEELRKKEVSLREAQAELAHVTRVTALGELAASIAHEVNQPLTAIINNANACLDLLPSEANQLDDVREALSDIANDAVRASTVLARIRGLIKKSPLQKTRLDLREVVSAVLILARNEAATRRVTIKSEIPEDLPFVSGDHVQLQQVLLNLIMNGMDAMTGVEEEERFLLISGRLDVYDGRPASTIAVQDCGLGLETEQLDRLFDPFYTTKPQGMGMGLAISRSIIEEHGGRLWAEPNKGPGATFLISLPAA